MLVFSDETTMETVSVLGVRYTMHGKQRSALRIEVAGIPVADILARFVDGVHFLIRTLQEDGTTSDTDFADYCIAGDIVDRRDGSYWIYVGQKTQEEINLYALVQTGVLTLAQYTAVTGIAI